MKKICLITNIPNPYRLPLFNRLNKILQANNYCLHIVFGSASYKRRFFEINEKEFEFDYSILDDKAITLSEDGEKSYFFYKGLSNKLKQINPDLIIVSGYSTATIKTAIYCKLRSIPFVIWSGAIHGKNRNQSIVRKIQRTILSKMASSFVCYGSLAKKYVQDYGALSNAVFIAMNTVDTDFYYQEAQNARSKINKDANVHFIYLGYLVPRKNVELLLKAAAELLKKRNDFIIDIVGDGISKSALIEFCNSNNLSANVVFHGFKQKNELPGLLANSRAMLFQTDFDIWGLVLNEAMATSTPCLASVNAGATHDLIVEGQTGFAADFSNIEEVTKKMEFFIENPGISREIGQRASDFIRTKVNLDNAALGFLNAINYALKK